jgi:PKD repeat protein
VIFLCTILLAAPSAASSPVAGFSTAATNGPAPVSVSFTDTTTNSPASWYWEYRIADNGTWTQFSTVQNPAGITFDTPGTYDIRLTATNTDGDNTLTKNHVFAVAKEHDYLATVSNGTVSGALYVDSVSPWETTASQTFTLPALSVNNITWAGLYINSYSGKATNDYALLSTVTLDGTTLGNETLDIESQTNGYVFPVNDHVTKVYSDYEAVYDVTSRISSTGPVVNVTNMKITGKAFDGKIKGITLVAAYNDGDSDAVRYSVNHGNDWISSGTGSSTTFAPGLAPSGWTNAELKSIAFSSMDAAYTFPESGSTVAPTALGTNSYWKYNSFNVTGSMVPGVSNTFGFTAGSTSPSFKTTLATLAVKYPAVPIAMAPVASFISSAASGTVPFTVVFTDTSTNTPTSWLWDFGDGDSTNSTVQNPVHTYAGTGTFTVNLTATNAAGSSFSRQAGYVTAGSGVATGPDLEVTAMTFNTGGSYNFLFANETNAVFVTVKNNGTAEAGTSVVSVDLSGIGYTANVGALAAGANQTVTVTDTTIRMGNTAVTVTATADSTGVVAESDETDNVRTSAQTVYNHGYKGKRYTGGSDITTKVVISGHNTLLYSPGSSAYASSNWRGSTTSWTSTDLPVPVGSEIVLARLYQPYSYDQTPGGYPIWSAAFNGNDITPEAVYKDRKGFGTYDYPYGLYVYNVTGGFSTTGNTLVLTNGSTNNNSLYGSYLVVVYRNASDTQKTIYFNEEADLLIGKSTYAVTGEEATAYAPFNSVDTTGMTGAKVIAIATGAGKAGTGNSTFLFNNQDYGSFVPGYRGTPQISMLSTDVTSTIHAGDNFAQFRSTGTSADTIIAGTAILVVESATISKPDLIVSAMTFNTGGSYNFLFANETNTVFVTVKNNGTAEAGTSVVSVDLSGIGYTANVGALAAGANQTVTVTDTTIRMGNTAVTVTATADSTGVVAESDETDNVRTSAQTVYNHGYKGKRYTGGSDITTKVVISGHNTLLYSPGSSAYASSNWRGSTTSWTSTDLPVPVGSEIVLARLYQPYSYDQTPGGYPIWSAAFNGNDITPEAVYKDRKGFGTYDYPYGLYVYNVTGGFSTTGNTLVLTNGSTNNNSLYGSYLVVVYRNASDTQKTIYFNEEADLLIGKPTYAVSGEEATAYAPFGSVDTNDLTGAKVIAIATGAGKTAGTGNSKFLFNNQDYGDFVAGYRSTPQISMLSTDVTGTIQPGENTARFQSTGASADTIVACTAILVVESAPSVTVPVASFTSSTASGTTPLTIIFTDTSMNTPTSWLWEFGDNDATNATVQNPVHTYASAGTYTVNLTATNAAGSTFSRQAGYVQATAPAGDYDLTISGGITLTKSPTELPLFARESNLVRIVSITNSGSTTSPATEVELRSSDGYVNRTAVPSLVKGETATVTIMDTKIRPTAGVIVNYTATVDPDNTIAETNEANNMATSSVYTVTYNGYKGKTYWEGQSNVTTKRSWDLHGGLVWSAGDSQYISGTSGRANGQPPQGSSWTTYPVTWTSGDLPVPAGSVIREARLYVPYTWDDSSEAPNRIHIDFNNERVPYEAWYHDKRNFAGSAYSNFEYGLLTYNVTGQFLKNGQNTAVFTREVVPSKITPYGFTLAVIYEDPTATRKQIFLNEEFDLLGVDANAFGTNSEEATAYVPFTGQVISPADVTNSTLITFVPSGNGPEGILLFNGNTLASNVWDYDSVIDTQVAVDSRDVTAYLIPDGNEAGIRGTGSNQAVMGAAQQFLVVEYKASTTGEPVAAFSSNVTRGLKPLAVRFEDYSSGSPSNWSWDFGDHSNATEQNPTHVYLLEGTYNVSLTVTNSVGNNSLTRNSFITVNKPAAVASFTVNKTSGDAPLAVRFLDTSTGEPETRLWDFGDSSQSTEADLVHTFAAAGTYTVTLTSANSAGSSTATASIAVNARTVEEKTFSIANLTTTSTASGQNVSVSTANSTLSGNTVILTSPGNGWETLGITMIDLPASDGVNLTGTVASVAASAAPVTVPITDVGMPALNYTLNLREVPNSTAQITMTITKDPDTAAQSSFTLAATGAGKQIDAIAYTVNFNKTCLANHGDNGTILNATIGMAVSPAWVTAHGGRDHIVIMRRADNGTTQVLATQYQGMDASGNELYMALSPDGLSTFILSSVSVSSSGSSSGSNGSSSFGGGGSSGGGSKLSSSAKEGQVYEYRAPSVTSYAWVEKTTVTDKGRVEILSLTAGIAAMPEIEARWTADIPQKPDGGGRLTTSIVQVLPGETRSLYRSALAGRGLDIGTIAYSMVVNEEGIPETKDAVIEMSVPQEWVKQNGGINQIKILRMDNEANVEILDTAFARYDTDSTYIVFRADSPHGLCTFSLVAVKAGSGIFQQAPANEPVVQPDAPQSAVLPAVPAVPAAAWTNLAWIASGIVLVIVACLALLVAKKQMQQRKT